MPVDGHDGSAARDGESDAAAPEGDDAAGTWTAPLPASRTERTRDCGLSSRSAWQPTGNAAPGKTLFASHNTDNISNYLIISHRPHGAWAHG